MNRNRNKTLIQNIKESMGHLFTTNPYYLLGLLALIGFIIIIEGYLDTFARMLSFLVVIIFAYGLITWSHSSTEDDEFWEDKDELSEEINLQVRDVKRVLKLASEGKEKSREKLHKKIEEIFFLKLKDEKDMSRQNICDLAEKPEEFQELVDDKMISEFILYMEGSSNSSDPNGEKKEKESYHIEKLKGTEYREYIRKLIQRIDGWSDEG